MSSFCQGDLFFQIERFNVFILPTDKGSKER